MKLTGTVLSLFGCAVIAASAAAPGRLTLSLEPRDVPPVYVQSTTQIYPHTESIPPGAAQTHAVLRWFPGCDWKTWTLQSRPTLDSGAWEIVPPENLMLSTNNNQVEAVDTRAVGSHYYYQLKVETIPPVYPLASVESPSTVFESSVALDEQYAYFGNAHGEVFRVSKTGASPPLMITSVNFSHLVRLLATEMNVSLPAEVITANNQTTFANDLAVLGVAVDKDNIYFSVNKVVSVTVAPTDDQIDLLTQVTGTDLSGLKGLSLTFYVMIPHTGAIFFVPKAATVVCEQTGRPVPAIPMALDLNGAAGIASDATHVYWSCLGSHADEVELAMLTADFVQRMIPHIVPDLLPAILTQNSKAINQLLTEQSGPLVPQALNTALTTVFLGMPPFRNNGMIQRQAKLVATPDILQSYLATPGNLAPEDVLILGRPETLAEKLSLPSRNIFLDSEFVYFGENGGLGSLVSYSPPEGASGIRKVPKSGGVPIHLSSTNNGPCPAFLVSRNASSYYSGGHPGAVGGLVGTLLPNFTSFGGIYQVTNTNPDPVAIIPNLILSGCTSGLYADKGLLYFNSTYLLLGGSAAPRDGSIRVMDSSRPMIGNPPNIPVKTASTLVNASTFALDDCSLFVTTRQNGSNTIYRIVR